MKILILFFAFFQISNSLEIDSISVFLEFKNSGYTTASAFSNFKNLKKNKIETRSLNSSEVNKINYIISNSNHKKHLQTKLGTNLIFANFTINGQVHKFILQKEVIIDLTTFKNYWIKNNLDIDSLESIRANIKNK